MTQKTTKTDTQIHRDVLEELRWDSRVDETEVGVEVDAGVVTLTGTVTSWAKRLRGSGSRATRDRRPRCGERHQGQGPRRPRAHRYGDRAGSPPRARMGRLRARGEDLVHGIGRLGHPRRHGRALEPALRRGTGHSQSDRREGGDQQDHGEIGASRRRRTSARRSSRCWSGAPSARRGEFRSRCATAARSSPAPSIRGPSGNRCWRPSGSRPAFETSRTTCGRNRSERSADHRSGR